MSDEQDPIIGTDNLDTERAPTSDKRHNVNVRNLYLDPNNYRFIDADAFVRVNTSEDPTRDDVQRRTSGLILGKNAENIKDLVESFKKNGFLPVDQIQVRQLGGGKYVVVEGNRRVACLKYLQRRHEQEGLDLGKLDPGIFQRVPVVYYQDANDAHHLILMGLKHISGNKKWPAINQAELIRDLTEKHGMSADDICASISINKKEYNLTLSTLRLIEQYRRSDFGDQFKPDMYSIFREITRNSALKTWLGWNDRDGTAARPNNLERIFSWISEDEIEDETDEDSETSIASHKIEPVITKATHIRELAQLIDDEVALKNIDSTRSLIQASMSSELLGRNRVTNSISIIGQELNSLFSMVKHLGNAERLDLKGFMNKITAILDAGGIVETNRTSTTTILHSSNHHFEYIKIAKYRRLKNVELSGLARLNLLAGINNSGKTSTLESVEILANLNRFKTLTDMVSRRSKLRPEEVRANWLYDQIPDWEITAKIGSHILAASSRREVEESLEQAFYVGSVVTEAMLGGENLGSVTRVYDRYPYETFGNVKALIATQFSSPYLPRLQDEMAAAYELALQSGLKDQIVTFINQHVDDRFAEIELVKDRFFVKIVAKNNTRYVDMANFGDGVQRIFGVCLLFASARNGVLILDEAESAIHSSLFGQLASLIYRLSVEFNVQVFLSTHSKECIDSFVNCAEIPKQDIVGFALFSKNDAEKAVRIDGDRLSGLVSSIDFDMRSVRG